MDERTKVEAVELFIVRSLIKGKSVVIPEFGQLEIKNLSDRRTVLFKSTENRDSLMRIMSAVGEKEKRAIKALYIIISSPLKEEKVVTLPKVGSFRPIRLDSGEIHVSFVLSTYLRKLLFEKESEIRRTPFEKEIKKIKEIKETKGMSYTDENTEETEIQEAPKEEIKIKINDIYASKSDGKFETTETLKSNDNITLEHTIDLSGRQKVIHAIDPIEPGDDFSGKSRLRDLSKVFLNKTFLYVASVGILILVVVSTIYSGDNKKAHQSKEVTLSNESISLPALAENSYGNAAFWIYIYEANMDKLSSPINIPRNVHLVIPDLKAEYDVDVTDSMEIQRANILADILLKETIKKERN